MMYLYRRSEVEIRDFEYLLTNNIYSFYVSISGDFSSAVSIVQNSSGWGSYLEYSTDRSALTCSFETIDEFKSNYPELFI